MTHLSCCTERSYALPNIMNLGPKQRGVGSALLAACVSGGKVSRVTCLCRAFKHRGNCGNHREPPPAGTGRYLRAYVVL